MPPLIALSLAIFLILYAFVLDRQRNSDVSAALWIPFLWMVLIGTRFASQWLDVGTTFHDPEDYLDGSPLDQAVFLFLYVAAVYVLFRRRISIATFMSRNKWLSIFLGYCLLSVLWSDYPWIALKRWLKVVEHVVMVLVVLSESNRIQAIDALFRRFSYLALTISVLFFKYFPELGRGFDNWTGKAINTGVTTDKNALGHICVLGGLFFVSGLVSKQSLAKFGGKKAMWLLDALMIYFAVWLLDLADAKTALVCFLIGVTLVILISRTRLGRSPRNAAILLILALAMMGMLEAMFDLSEVGIRALNRDPTLTDRTTVWADVLAVDNNSIIGTGFESFWLGPKLDALWQKYWWHPNQAHNGYIETYINLGAIGIALLIGMIGAGFVKVLRSLASDPQFGPLRLALLVAILIFNYTDATFKALHILYFVFFLIVVDYPEKPDSSGSRVRAAARGTTRVTPDREVSKT